MSLPIQAISAHDMLRSAAAPSPELQPLADRFNQMMAKHPDPAFYASEHGQDGATPLSHFVQAQEGTMRQTFNDVREFTQQAPAMDVQTMAMRHIELSYQLSMVQVQFNAGVYVAQSSKSGLQTLMKNQ